MPDFRFVGFDEAKAFTTMTSTRTAIHLLWGDRVEVLDESGPRTKIRARGRNRTGFVDPAALNGKALLEFYFIDVGQGDGVLIVTPDRKHVLIDGGYPRAKQNTGKSAADFVDWKFFSDYALDTITLDLMICSHNDEDHYGGLADLFDVSQSEELDCGDVRVDKFLHAGLSWWKTPSSSRTLGATTKIGSRHHYTDLISNRTSVRNGLKDDANPKLQGRWADFLEKVTGVKTAANGTTPFARLSHLTGTLDISDDDDIEVSVLGPVEAQTSNGPGLIRYTGGTSKNTNGHSVLLRVDYKDVKVLLTGDLNMKSQRQLLQHYANEETVFLCDVAKACHHGSDDVSFEFLAAMKPAVTVISSGDAEGHDHPRPQVVGASGVTGYLTIKNDQIHTPLIYSTELARSVSLGVPSKLDIRRAGQPDETITGTTFKRSKLHFSETKPGALNATKKTRTMGNTYVVAGQVYGLVNVRTDGEKIVCATMNEGNGSWQVQTLKGRF